MSNSVNLDLIASILAYLKRVAGDEQLSIEKKESLEVDAFPDAPGTSNIDLGSVVFSSQAPQNIDVDGASAHKKQGNDALLAKNYLLAIDEYTKAIELNPNDPIFYSNRAAAWMHLKGSDDKALQKAEEDCLKALRLDPTYAKAQTRLGSVYLAQKRTKEAIDALEKALEMDPSSTNTKLLLTEAKGAGERNTEPPHVNPGFDLSSLLADPNLMSMAQNFMNSDAAKGLLSNPNIANLASQFLGGNNGSKTNPSNQ